MLTLNRTFKVGAHLLATVTKPYTSLGSRNHRTRLGETFQSRARARAASETACFSTVESDCISICWRNPIGVCDFPGHCAEGCMRAIALLNISRWPAVSRTGSFVLAVGVVFCGGFRMVSAFVSI